MPVRLQATRVDKDDPLVLKYSLSAYFDLCPVQLKAIRVAAIKRRDEMAALKVQFGKSGDRDTSRFFKEEEADALKEYRAVCLLLPWYTQDIGGDCPVRDFYAVGPELFPYLCRVERECELT